MKKVIGRGLLVAALLVTALSFGTTTDTSAQEATTIIVSPDDMHGWGFVDDNEAGGTGEMVQGPSNAPIGVGSARLAVDNSDQGYMLGTVDYLGLDLSDITTLEYTTFQSSEADVQAIVLQLNIDVDPDDNLSEWQGRLSFEPYHDGTVQTNQWQTWNTLSDAESWWFSGSPGNQLCPQSDPCSLDEILHKYPTARIHPTLGGIGFKAGSGWANFDGNVDKLVIGIDGVNTTYDFEPFRPCVYDATSDSTMTLRTDCGTIAAISLEDGFTYDGAGHTITAYGAFDGPVISASSAVIAFTNTNIDIDDSYEHTDGLSVGIRITESDEGTISIHGNSVSELDVPIINTYTELCYTVWSGSLRVPTSGCAPWEKSRRLAVERGNPATVRRAQSSPICVRNDEGLARYVENGDCGTLWSWWDEEQMMYPNSGLISICVNDDTGRVRIVDVDANCSSNEWAGQI